jgi:hypothetical protein
MHARLVAIVVCGGLSAASHAEAGKVPFEKAGLVVDAPDSWTTLLANEGTVRTFLAPDKRIYVEMSTSADSVDDTWQRWVDRFQRSFPDLKLNPGQSGYSSMLGYVGLDDVVIGGVVYTIELGVIAAPTGTLSVYSKVRTSTRSYSGDDVPSGPTDEEYAEYQQILFGMTPLVVPEVPAGAKTLSTKVVRAIERGDAGAFVKLVGKQGLDGTRPSKLKRRIKKAGGLVAFLGVRDAGDWHVEVDLDGATVMWRGELEGSVLLILRKEKKRWVISVAGRHAP